MQQNVAPHSQQMNLKPVDAQIVWIPPSFDHPPLQKEYPDHWGNSREVQGDSPLSCPSFPEC